MNNCRFCSKEIPSHNTYCDTRCQVGYQSKQKLDAWLSGESVFTKDRDYPVWMKRYVLERQLYRCKICGLSEWMGNPITLELEHIDGNATNSVPENLSCLCPNCHSQTPTYKAKNKGNGRDMRKKLLPS